MELNNKKKIIIISALLLVIVIIVFTTLKIKSNSKSVVINDNKPIVSEQVKIDYKDEAMIEEEEKNIVLAPTTAEATKALKEAVVLVPGTNPVSKENQVLTMAGVPAKNDIAPNSPEAPKQSAPIVKQEVDKVETGTVKIDISNKGFTPNQFTIAAGSPVSLIFSQTMMDGHLIKFVDESLSAITISLGPEETRAITFNAPKTPGEYIFKCDMPNHANRGEIGKMIVK